MALFEPGQSGNPNGRPPGSRNKTTVAIEQLLEDAAETIARKAIELAKSGDTALIRLCLNRLSPPRRDRHIPFALPEIHTPADALDAVAAITNAVAAGELTPSEAASLSQLAANYAKAIEVVDLEERLCRLEEARANRARPNRKKLRVLCWQPEAGLSWLEAGQFVPLRAAQAPY